MLITIGYHARSADALADRFDALIWGPPTVAGRLRDPNRLTVLEPGKPGPAGAVAHRIGKPVRGERPHWLPAHAALAFGDAVVATPDGELRLWAQDPVDENSERSTASGSPRRSRRYSTIPLNTCWSRTVSRPSAAAREPCARRLPRRPGTTAPEPGGRSLPLWSQRAWPQVSGTRRPGSAASGMPDYLNSTFAAELEDVTKTHGRGSHAVQAFNGVSMSSPRIASRRSWPSGPARPPCLRSQRPRAVDLRPRRAAGPSSTA